MAEQHNLMFYLTPLLLVLQLVFGAAGVLFWHMFRRVEKKLDDWYLIHADCRERQANTFVKKIDFDHWEKGPFEDWKKGRDFLWKRINQHSHRENGKVVIEE